MVPSLPQMLCTTPLTGCPAWVGFPTIAEPPWRFADSQSGDDSGRQPGCSERLSGCIACRNFRQPSVTFFGVPVMPPTTTGTRVFRITNVRVNATPLIGGSASGACPIQATIAISGATSLSITNSTPIVGFVSAGLTASASSAAQPQSVLLADQDLGQYTYVYRELWYGVQDQGRCSELPTCMLVRSAIPIPERSRRHLQLRVQLRVPGSRQRQRCRWSGGLRNPPEGDLQ